MNTATALTQPMTPEQFLAWEESEELRYEFDGLRVIAMTGGTANHHRIVGNLRRALERRVPNGCEVFTETFKLGIDGKFRYPDVMVVCRPPVGDTTITDSAVLVVEVLSPSSAHTGRVEKLVDYARVPDLETYLIVDPAVRNVVLYRRRGAGFADVTTGETLDLGHDIALTLADIYQGVQR